MLTHTFGLMSLLAAASSVAVAAVSGVGNQAFNPRAKWQADELNCIQILNPASGARYQPGYFVRMNYDAVGCPGGAQPAGPWTIHLYNNPQLQHNSKNADGTFSAASAGIHYDYHKIIADNIHQSRTQYLWTIPMEEDQEMNRAVTKPETFFVRIETMGDQGQRLVGNAGPFSIAMTPSTGNRVEKRQNRDEQGVNKLSIELVKPLFRPANEEKITLLNIEGRDVDVATSGQAAVSEQQANKLSIELVKPLFRPANEEKITLLNIEGRDVDVATSGQAAVSEQQANKLSIELVKPLFRPANEEKITLLNIEGRDVDVATSGQAAVSEQQANKLSIELVKPLFRPANEEKITLLNIEGRDVDVATSGQAAVSEQQANKLSIELVKPLFRLANEEKITLLNIEGRDVDVATSGQAAVSEQQANKLSIELVKPLFRLANEEKITLLNIEGRDVDVATSGQAAVSEQQANKLSIELVKPLFRPSNAEKFTLLNIEGRDVDVATSGQGAVSSPPPAVAANPALDSTATSEQTSSENKVAPVVNAVVPELAVVDTTDNNLAVPAVTVTTPTNSEGLPPTTLNGAVDANNSPTPYPTPTVTPIETGGFIPNTYVFLGSVIAGGAGLAFAGGYALGKVGAVLGAIVGAVVGGLAVVLTGFQ